MKRKIYNTLKIWKEKRANKEALLIDGARRVGKSWIAEEFARNEYLCESSRIAMRCSPGRRRFRY